MIVNRFCVAALALGAILQIPVGVVAQESEKNVQRMASVKAKANSGDPRAQSELGAAYLRGEGMPANNAEAIKWFRKAAEQGDAVAQDWLGQIFAMGYGVPVDNLEAEKWLRRAAEQGDALGQFGLAAMYSEGKGVSKDEAEAFKWLSKAADQGFAPAQFGLGQAYENGRGIAPSLVEAFKWYKKAADQDYPDALNSLAFIMATSKVDKLRDPDTAIAIAQKAVNISKQNPFFIDTLARCYFEAGQYGKAVDAERDAVALSPENESYKNELQKYLDASNQKP